MGRTSSYSKEIGETICDRVISGRTLSDVSKDDDMPCRKTMYTWMRNHPEFDQMYQQARRILVEQWVDEIIDISDNREGDPQRDRLSVDSRKWLACKVVPKMYGDRQTLTHEAPSGFAFTMNPPPGKDAG